MLEFVERFPRSSVEEDPSSLCHWTELCTKLITQFTWVLRTHGTLNFANATHTGQGLSSTSQPP